MNSRTQQEQREEPRGGPPTARGRQEGRGVLADELLTLYVPRCQIVRFADLRFEMWDCRVRHSLFGVRSREFGGSRTQHLLPCHIQLNITILMSGACCRRTPRVQQGLRQALVLESSEHGLVRLTLFPCLLMSKQQQMKSTSVLLIRCSVYALWWGSCMPCGGPGAGFVFFRGADL